MANLKEVKSRITSVSSTQQITKAMKMVSASKLRKAQDRIVQMRPYAEKLSAILANVSAASSDEVSNPYAAEREVKKVLMVVVSSDKGLAGAFNSNTFRKTLSLIKENYQVQQEKERVYILPVGKKSLDFFRKRKYNIVGKEHVDLFGRLSFDEARVAAEFAMESFAKGDFDKVELIYNEFKNVATQVVKAEQLLPIPIVSQEDGDNKKSNPIDFIYEPSEKEIVEELIPKSLKIKFYRALLESNASEHGARMTAMDKATDNAGELLKELRLTYNRTRQAAITTEILEIVAGAEALASGK